MEALDFFEGVANDRYQRERVVVALKSGEKLEVGTYVAGSQLVDTLEGDWDPTAFKRDSLEFYVENVVSRFVSLLKERASG